MTLHNILQGVSTSECEWLLPPRKARQQFGHSVPESRKRRELLEEFLFWYFDQFLLPLLKVCTFIYKLHLDSNAYRLRFT